MRKFINVWFVTVVALVLAVSATAITYRNVQYERIINSIIEATPIGAVFPSTGNFTNLSNTTGGGTIIDTFIGNLTGNVSGNVTGALFGNATTASALAATPSNCGTGPANGIQANGNANCLGSGSLISQEVQITTLCTTAGTAYATCSPASASSWPLSFTNTSYGVSCSVIGLSSGVVASVFPSSRTNSTIGLTIQNGTGSGATATTPSEIDCIAVGIRQ